MRRDLAILALLFALPLILFWPQTVGGQTLLPAENLYQWEPYYTYRAAAGAPDVPHNHLLSDLVLQNYQWKSFSREAFSRGDIPLWNPHQFSGIPFLAAGQQQVFYPLSLIYYVLPLSAAYGWFTVVNLWLAGVFIYLFVRALGISRFGATIAGITYQLCGMFVASAVFPMIIGASVWLPLLLMMAEYILRRRPLLGRDASPLWASIGAVGLACSVLSGHAEITIYTLLITGYYGAFRLIGMMFSRRGETGLVRDLITRGAWLSALIVLGLALSAIQLIPLVEFVQTNWRAERSSLDLVLSYAHKPRDIIQFVLPNFYGSPAHHGYYDLFTQSWQPGMTRSDGVYIDWGIKNYVEGALYLGILPLILAGFALVSPRGKTQPPYRLLFAGLGAASLTFMFGLPTYALIYVLPGINQLNSPFRWIYGVTIAVAVLAAFGADAVTVHRKLARRVGTVTIAAGIFVLGGLTIGRLTFDLWSPSLEPMLMGLQNFSNAFRDVGMFYSYVFPQVLALGAFLIGSGVVVLWLRGDNVRVSPVHFAAVGLLAIDLMLASWGFNAASDPALLDYVPPAVAYLQEHAQDSRYTVLNTDGRRDILQANMTMRYGLDDVRGYDSIISKQYVDYMEPIHNPDDLLYNRISPLYTWMNIDGILNSVRFKRLNIKYVVTHTNVDITAEGWQQVYEDQAVRIYEDTRNLGRAYFLERPEDIDAPLDSDGVVSISVFPATLTSDTGRQKTVDVVTDRATWLVLSETYAPGWKAFVRYPEADPSTEREIPVRGVYENFIGVQLDAPGWYTVRFIYSPPSFQVGAFGTIIGAALTLLASGIWLWQASFAKSHDGSASRLARNSIAPIILNLFNRGIDFAFAAVMFRILGPERAGEYYYAIVVFGWFDIFTNFGLDIYLMREAGRLRSRAAALFASTSVFRLILVVVGLPLMGLFILLRQSLVEPLDLTVLLTIGLFYVGLIPGSLSKGLTSLYYAFERAEFPAIVTTLTTISKVTGGVLALLMGWGVIGLAAVSIVTNLITLVVLVLGARSMLAESRETRPNRSDIRRMAAQSWPLMLNHFLATVFFQIDIILLEAMRGERIVGLYRVAYSWLLAINVVPAFFTQALMATMSRQAHDDRAALWFTYRLGIKLLVSIALPFAVAITVLAEPLTWLLGGAAYLPDGQIALQIMVWSIPIGWMNSLTQYALVALDLQRRVTFAFAAACAFNIVANLIFIPQYSYQAAAITTILSEFVLFVGFAYLIQTGIGRLDWLKMLWKPYAAAVAMGVFVWLITPLTGSLLAVFTGSLVYIAVLLTLRPLDPEELNRVAPALPGRARRLLGAANVA
jgi:O-antigen/teichoic acid export membrane protein